MKILLISASPHKEKSRTFFLAKEVLKGCVVGTRHSKIIHLCDYKIEFCRHCEECHRKIMQCPRKDDVLMILKSMLEAEGIILASPNYINQIAASMKALFDRSTHFIHCKRLLGKYIVGVVSSGSGQDRDVLDYIKHYAHTCGAQYSGGVSSFAFTVKEKTEEACRLGKRLASDIKGKRTYPEQMKIIETARRHFGKIIQIRKNDWIDEYQYWQDRGWL